MSKPTPRDEGTRRRLSQQARQDTKPELVLRRELHRRGLRYRTHVGVLRGSRIKHDIVFSRARVVVEIRGCFWHSCRLHGTVPSSNRDWWIEKLGQNVARDERVERELVVDGWRLVTVWEHDDVDEAADRIELAVRTSARVEGLGDSQ